MVAHRLVVGLEALGCALLLAVTVACSGSPDPAPNPPTRTTPASDPPVAYGTVTGTVPLCIGPAIMPGTNPVYHATLQVTAASGSTRTVKVTTHYRPDRFSLRLPVGSYRVHDLARGWDLPNNHVTVRAGSTSHVNLGFMSCM